jgi:hypothetical protein
MPLTRDMRVKAVSDKLKSENDAILQKVSKLGDQQSLDNESILLDDDVGLCSFSLAPTHLLLILLPRLSTYHIQSVHHTLCRALLSLAQYAKLKKFVKDQKKRTAKVSKKHEWAQRKSRLQQDT